jgi:hypothetical protein
VDVLDRCREIAFGLGGLALVGLACGRVDLDPPLGLPVGATGAVAGAPGNGDPGIAGGRSGNAGVAGAPGTGGAAGDVPCRQISDEASCLRRGSACRADYCTSFVRCANPDDSRLPCAVPPGASCPMLSRPPIIACPSTPWCHPVYSAMPPPEVCPSPNVCITLIACADNGTAQCNGATGTRCGGDPPACAAGYTPALNSAGCYEGCVPLAYCGS